MFSRTSPMGPQTPPGRYRLTSMRSLPVLILVALAATACSSTAAVPSDGTTTLATTTTTVPVTTTIVPPTTTTTATTTTTTTTTLPRGSVSEDARAVVLAGLPGTVLDATTNDFLAAGGRAVILFSKNLESRAQTRALTSAMACAAGTDILVAVDQEPGRVERLAKIGIPSPSLDGTREQFIAETMEMGKAMFNLGINFDLAPVLDVARGSNPVLVGRNFGPDPVLVADRGVDFQTTLESFGIVTCCIWSR